MSATGSGNGVGYCCGVSSVLSLVSYKYAEGSILFDCKKASKGCLYYVAIKSVRLISNSKTHGKIVPLYIDTFNELWNEDDLCTESEAREAAIEYLLAQREAVLAQLQSCN